MPKPLFVPRDAINSNKSVILKVTDKLIVIVEVDRIAVNERHMDVFALILAVDHKPPFELHLQEGLAVDVAGDEIRALPIVGQPQAIEAIVRQTRGHLVEVVVFLLTRIQIGIGDRLKHATPPPLWSSS